MLFVAVMNECFDTKYENSSRYFYVTIRQRISYGVALEPDYESELHEEEDR